MTVNRVVDYIRDRSEEQQLSVAGLREEEDIFSPVWDSVKNRAPWLLLNLPEQPPFTHDLRLLFQILRDQDAAI